MWVCVGMATKNISITEEAYRRLANLRKRNESFSEIIMGVTGKRAKLSDFHGILSGKAADALEKSIKESREIHRALHKKRIERLKGSLQ